MTRRPPKPTLFPSTPLSGWEEVLAAGLADEARIGPVAGDVGADRAPQVLESRGRAGEVDARDFPAPVEQDRKSTRLNSSHANISYAVVCLKKKIGRRQHASD